MNDPGRRPIQEAELPFLQALGARVKDLRLASGLSVEELARRLLMSPTTIWRVESARRRTRRSTLELIVAPIVTEAPWLGEPLVLVDELVALAGPALAPESPHRERIERRRERRARQREAELERWRRLWDS